MKNVNADEGVRERLLVAGLKELEEHGFNDFSLRRVAANCNVSCAAPYKHFKSKDELIAALSDYVNDRWTMLKEHILTVYADLPEKELALELCVAYTRFLLATPMHITVMAGTGKGLIAELADGDSFSEVRRAQALYSICAYIYGTVCLIKGNAHTDADAAMDMFRRVMARILDNTFDCVNNVKDNEG